MVAERNSRWGRVTAGHELLALVRHAYGAGIPLMLHGPRGVGKSMLLAEAARSMGIGWVVLDLSVMEPTDLAGLPREHNGRTVFAPPLLLPDQGRGILVIEEINRVPRYMQTPCLQLLTARRINRYRLPDGWLPCAAVNPRQEGYHVDVLDEAMTSRWINVHVEADEDQWAEWGRTAGIHPAVLDYVREARPFRDPEANPRAWSHASKILGAVEPDGNGDGRLLEVMLSGVVSSTWAQSFLAFYGNREQSLSPADILDGYPAHRERLKAWVRESRLDLIRNTLERLQAHLRARPPEQTDRDGTLGRNLEAFFSDVPVDLMEQSLDWLPGLSMEQFLLTGEQEDPGGPLIDQA